MIRKIKTSLLRSNPAEFVFALKFRAAVREISVVKVTSSGDYYVFTPYARLDTPPVDVHMSKHRRGERHLSVRFEGGKHHFSRIKLQPTSSLSGVELVTHMPLFKDRFSELPPAGSNKGKVILLDADSADFRDDFLAFRVHLAQPDKEHEISMPPDVGPYLRYIEKSCTPWVVVEVFQEKIRASG